MIYGVMQQEWRTGLKARHTRGAQVIQTEPSGWRLEIPAGPPGQYRLAQLDDYGGKPRGKFPWRAPFHLALRVRASASEIPGTWGLGLWNNPFGMGVYSLPVLPNAAWFFYASRQNYLSLRDDLPAQGGLAAAFQSPRCPAGLLMVGAPFLPFLALPPVVRLLRRVGRGVVRQDAAAMRHDPTDWHTYALEWAERQVQLWVDGQTVLQTTCSPGGPLGLVIWVDNQYAAAPPDGGLRFGALENPEPAWIECETAEAWN